MKKNAVISPEILHTLCNEPMPSHKTLEVTQTESNNIEQYKPRAEKKSFWKKAGTVIKKCVSAIISVLAVLPPLLNAISRFKNSSQIGRRTFS